MKYEQYIILAILFFLISACQPIIEEKEISETKTQTEKKINEIDVHDLEILVIDNCEYIFYKKSRMQIRGSVLWLIKEIVKTLFIFTVKNRRSKAIEQNKLNK